MRRNQIIATEGQWAGLSNTVANLIQGHWCSAQGVKWDMRKMSIEQQIPEPVFNLARNCVGEEIRRGTIQRFRGFGKKAVEMAAAWCGLKKKVRIRRIVTFDYE